MLRDELAQTSSSASFGTGNLLLDGAVANRIAFAVEFADNDKFYYRIEEGSLVSGNFVPGGNWEVGEGHLVTGSPKSIARDRVIRSSAANSLVNFGTGVKLVSVVLPSEVFGPSGGALYMATTTGGGGSPNAYVAATLISNPTLKDGARVRLRFNAANTDIGTLALNATAAKPLRKNGLQPLAPGDINPRLIYDIAYDLTNDVYQIVGVIEGGVITVAGTTYTIDGSAHGKLLRFTSATGCAVTVSQAINAFAAPFWFDWTHDGAGGFVTFTPTTSTIGGGSSLSAGTKQSGRVYSDSANYQLFRGNSPQLPMNAVSGNTVDIANNGTDAVNDIDFRAQSWRSDDNAFDLTIAATNVKQLDVAFAEYSVIGTASGGRDSADNLTGAKTFHCYLIGGAGKNTQGFFSTSLAPTLPSGFTWKRRVHSILWTGSTIRTFVQNQDLIRLVGSLQEFDATNPGTSAVTRTLAGVPTGIQVLAKLSAGIYTGTTSANHAYFSGLDQTDEAVVAAGTAALANLPGNIGHAGASTAMWRFTEIHVMTNASAQIRTRLFASGAADHVGAFTFGWFDPRSI